jgi:hypothetical protein
MASINRFFWKVWLRLNLLTKDVDNDYTASVSYTGKRTLRPADIARLLVEGRTEYQYDTVLNIFNMGDRIIREQIQHGSSVLTGVCHISPRVSGNWIGASAKFDPDRHRITVDMAPSTELREALKEVGIEVLGVKDDGAFIGLVTDTATGLTDGTITPNDDILIEGDKLKITPEDEPELGVFFVDDKNEVFAVKRRLTQNDPKRILARTPALPAGQYTLRVVTRFSNQSTMLKEPRTIEYDQILIIL